MRTENDCPANQRFLFSDAYLSESAVKLWQEQTVKRFLNREKNEHYFNFINWKQNERELAIYTLYAYADLELGKAFNCIFSLNDPDDFVFSNVIVKQSIYEGWAPVNTIDSGHKHLLILEFEDEIPDLVYRLYKENKLTSSVPSKRVILGFCNQEHFGEISSELKEEIGLKQKHGTDWWKYSPKHNPTG